MNELIADELAKLAKLKDQGVLTEEEFATRKAVLLGRKPSSSLPAPLQAFFGCLGLIALVVVVPQIFGLIRGECVNTKPPMAATPFSDDLDDLASDAAQDATAAASRANELNP